METPCSPKKFSKLNISFIFLLFTKGICKVTKASIDSLKFPQLFLSLKNQNETKKALKS